MSPLPERALSTADTVRLWSRDRAALGDCGARHDALAKAVTVITERDTP